VAADGAGYAVLHGARVFTPAPRRAAAPSIALRHRVRRALLALGLSQAQRLAVCALRNAYEELAEARQCLDDCRRALRRELGRPSPDSARLSELLLSERLLDQRVRHSRAQLDRGLAALLTPAQQLRVHALAPEVLAQMLGRLVLREETA
jgi:Spy/CpxP family protein refolding chaperone